MTDHIPDLETVRQAISLATRAPSVHNTQPWRWVVEGGTFHLFADWTRQAPVTDPDGRDLVLSCGAALHHLRVALAGLGWTSRVHRLPDPADTTHLATVETQPYEPEEDDVLLASAIWRRRTDRRRFSSWPVHPWHLEVLAGAATSEGGIAVVVTDPTARFHLAGAIAQAAVVQRSKPGYAVEMAIWSGHDEESRDGVPAAAVLEPAGAAESDPRRRAAGGGTRTQPSGKRHGEMSSLLVVASPCDDLSSRLRAGEATSAVLLQATELELATCTMSQPLEIADTRGTVQDEVLHGGATPQLIIRLGWAPLDADPLPGSPRRSIDEVASGIGKGEGGGQRLAR